MHKFGVGDFIRYVTTKKGQPTYRILEVKENYYKLEAIFPSWIFFGLKIPSKKKKVECKLYKDLAHCFYRVDKEKDIA